MAFTSLRKRCGRRAVSTLFLTTALAIVSGCASTVSSEGIPAFRHGVATTSIQAGKTFNETNAFLRRQQIERAVTHNALSEEMFVDGLGADDISKWSRAFALMESYAGKLERLLSDDQRAGVQEELAQLGYTIDVNRKAGLPAETSAAFTSLGGLLISLQSEQDALAAIRKADPAIQAAFAAMMEAIGEHSDAGVRGTVRTSWNTILARIDVREFRQGKDMNARRQAVLNYVGAMDERDAQDQLLQSLRTSLGALAKSHHELAAGRNRSAQAMLQFVQDEYKEYQEQLKVVKESRLAKDAKEG